MADEISATMLAALDYIREEGGGAVERREGGFWLKSSEPKFVSGMVYVKTSTINALERRGLVEIAYPNRIPRATLTAAGIKASSYTPHINARSYGVPGVDARTFSHHTPMVGKDEQ